VSEQRLLGGATAQRSVSRRELLKRACGGMAVGIVTAALADTFGEEPAAARAKANTGLLSTADSSGGRASISLIIDDGSPVDPLFYEIPGYESPLVVPHDFTLRVAETMERFDLRGKLTIIPMPSCLGRLDQSLKRVPPEDLEDFLR
jgi:hypothetical protein